MKRIILSLGIIAAVAAVGIGATTAIFSYTDSITGNTISTATVEIDAKGEARGGILAKPINVTNLVPGQYTSWARGAIWNKSTVPVKLYMYVDNVSGAACDKTNLRVTTGHACDGCTGERARDVYNNTLLGLQGSGKRVEVTGTPPFTTIPSTWTQVIQQIAQLDASADDNYQNTSCTWDEVFVAETVVP